MNLQKEQEIKERLCEIFLMDTSIENKMSLAETFMCGYIAGFGFDTDSAAWKVREEYESWHHEFGDNWSENKLREYLDACAFEYFINTPEGTRATMYGLRECFRRADIAAVDALHNMSTKFLGLWR
jgi:hypothetical protein